MTSGWQLSRSVRMAMILICGTKMLPFPRPKKRYLRVPAPVHSEAADLPPQAKEDAEVPGYIRRGDS